MIARIGCTALGLALAATNFFGGVLLPPGPFNPFGVLFLAVAGAFWFGWETVEDAHAYQEERRRAGRKIPKPEYAAPLPRSAWPGSGSSTIQAWQIPSARSASFSWSCRASSGSAGR
jgi:hypothetical protein